jgi:hypothetical protein
MNNHITMQQCIDTLQANGLAHGVLALQNGAQAVISQYSGHVLGPFLQPGGESLLWTSAVLADADKLAALVSARDWNIGGDRYWIAPEIQYYVGDRDNYRATLAVPQQMDPGNYSLEQIGDDAWKLGQEVTMEAHNLNTGSKTLQVERVLRPVPDPLRNLSSHAELLEGVVYAGYEQVVTLTDTEPNQILSESWSVTQVNPGGDLWIPSSAAVEVTDYYAPIDDAHLHRQPGLLRLAVSGHTQYKVGIQAAQVFGRMAYTNTLDDGRAYLVVRGFHNNPSAPYLEEPPHVPGRSGHAMHVYNDDGGLGGFGEMECGGQAIGGALGRHAGTDQYLLWFYVGPAQKIDAIFANLIGVRP